VGTKTVVVSYDTLNPQENPTVTQRQIWLNLGGLGVLIALLGLTYWPT